MHRKTQIQSIVFPKSKFSLPQALEWLGRNGFTHRKVDITPNTLRFRQHSPVPGKYITKTLPNGIELVIRYETNQAGTK